VTIGLSNYRSTSDIPENFEAYDFRDDPRTGRNTSYFLRTGIFVSDDEWRAAAETDLKWAVDDDSISHAQYNVIVDDYFYFGKKDLWYSYLYDGGYIPDIWYSNGRDMYQSGTFHEYGSTTVAIDTGAQPQ
jgi:hypothetical protein